VFEQPADSFRPGEPRAVFLDPIIKALQLVGLEAQVYRYGAR
jgi:hypothetical protein